MEFGKRAKDNFKYLKFFGMFYKLVNKKKKK